MTTNTDSNHQHLDMDTEGMLIDALADLQGTRRPVCTRHSVQNHRERGVLGPCCPIT